MDAESEQGQEPSSLREKNYPTIDEMLERGRRNATRIRLNAKDSLLAWIDQSELLWMAREHPTEPLHGDDYLEFARSIGVPKSTSKGPLPRLHLYREKIIARCESDREIAETNHKIYKYPSWEKAFRWYEPKPPTKKDSKSGETGVDTPIAGDLVAKLRTEEQERQAVEKLLKEAHDREYELAGQLAKERERVAELEAELARYRAGNTAPVALQTMAAPEPTDAPTTKPKPRGTGSKPASREVQPIAKTSSRKRGNPQQEKG